MKKDALYYIQQGLRRIRDSWNGSPEPADRKPETGTGQDAPSTDSTVMDYTAWQMQLRDRLRDRLRETVRDRRRTADSELVIYIEDTARLDQAGRNALGNYLKDWLEFSINYTFRRVALREGQPASGLYSSTLMPGVSMALVREQAAASTGADTPTVPSRAKVTVMDGCCILKDGDVHLAGRDDAGPDDRSSNRWNIGFGAYTSFDGRMARTNRIALEWADPVEHANDPYPVSRAHAHIRYKPGHGFFFYVDPRGVGKRTVIQRNDTTIPVTDVRMSVRLLDDDIIILNRELLRFNITDNNN